MFCRCWWSASSFGIGSLLRHCSVCPYWIICRLWGGPVILTSWAYRISAAASAATAPLAFILLLSFSVYISQTDTLHRPPLADVVTGAKTSTLDSVAVFSAVAASPDNSSSLFVLNMLFCVAFVWCFPLCMYFSQWASHHHYHRCRRWCYTQTELRLQHPMSTLC